MKKYPGLTRLFFLLAIIILSPVNAQTLHFVTAALPPIAPSANKPGYMELIAREAFARVGVDVTVSVLPGERALINANSGLDDGDLLRIPGLEKVYPNLIRIPEKVMDFEFVAFTRDDSINIESIADLKPYTVAYASGWKFYEMMVKETKGITTVRGLPELFILLGKERTEVVLAEHWQGLWAAREVGVDVTLQQPPFRVSDMYIYLHKRHSALVPEVAKALVSMKSDGTFQRIMNQTLKPLSAR